MLGVDSGFNLSYCDLSFLTATYLERFLLKGQVWFEQAFMKCGQLAF